ncbi:MAG: hypothetical protein JXB14_03815 [Candidatus Altiarchaeota archaeon]|nr:hypothetical protein [Candidatus Altiarchaeota archaeon]
MNIGKLLVVLLVAVVVVFSLNIALDYMLHSGKHGIADNVLLADQNQSSQTEKKVVFMLFYSPMCPHCSAEKSEFIPYITEKYPGIEIKTYNVYDENERQVLMELSEKIGFSPQSVPITVVGSEYANNYEYYVGYASLDTTGKFLEGMVARAFECLDNKTSEVPVCNETEPGSENLIDLPFFGKVDMSQMMGSMGIPMSTMVLGLLDGFNPCAFFVLTMLLSFMAYARSKRKMLIIGLTFIFVSGFVYFIFMTALFSVIAAINEIRVVAIAGGGIALIIGIINLKDFFFFKKGISLTISESKKPKLYKRMRDLLKSQNTIELLVSTIILAFVANSYELLCTAGIPIVYGNLLNAQQIGFFESVMYIALYNIFYVLPLLVIVLMFVKSLGGKKLTQEQGEVLKSISGIMMLGFGIFLLFDPTILSNIIVTGSLIGFAVIISLVLSKLKGYYKKTHGQRGDNEDGTAKKPEV